MVQEGSTLHHPPVVFIEQPSRWGTQLLGESPSIKRPGEHWIKDSISQQFLHIPDTDQGAQED